MKCLDCFLAQLRAGQIENEHTVESTNEELAEYNRRALAGGLQNLYNGRNCRWDYAQHTLQSGAGPSLWVSGTGGAEEKAMSQAQQQKP